MKKLIIMAMFAAGAMLSKPAFAFIKTEKINPEPGQMKIWRAPQHNNIYSFLGYPLTYRP